MIGFALQHTMSLERFKKSNYDGTATFKSPETVKCYREDKAQRVINQTGEEVTSNTNYYSKVAVGIQDRIDGHDVISVDSFDMLGCKYYRSYV